MAVEGKQGKLLFLVSELNEYRFSAVRDGEYHDKNKVHSQAWMLGPASLVYDWPVLVAALQQIFVFLVHVHSIHYCDGLNGACMS